MIVAIKTYRLYCEICNYSTITDGIDIKLVEYKRSSVQKSLSEPGEFLTLPKKFKCPKCGRLLTSKQIKVESDKKVNEQDNNKGSKGGFERW